MLKFITILSFLALVGCVTAEKRETALLHQRIGLSYYDSGNFPLALQEFKTANDLDPKNPAILNNLGLTYFMREHFDLAEEHVKKALAMNSNFTDARNNLARI